MDCNALNVRFIRLKWTERSLLIPDTVPKRNVLSYFYRERLHFYRLFYIFKRKSEVQKASSFVVKNSILHKLSMERSTYPPLFEWIALFLLTGGNLCSSKFRQRGSPKGSNYQVSYFHDFSLEKAINRQTTRATSIGNIVQTKIALKTPF